MNSSSAIRVTGLTHHYDDRCAVNDLSFDVEVGEIFAFVGPNGGGKTTLFRVLSTLVPLQKGDAAIFGHSLRTDASEIRRQIGVVFQAPGLDHKLSVDENLRHQGHLYGLTAASLRERCDKMLSQLGLTARRGDLVEKLSGGLRRRVELAKGMLHRPRLLLLDEPSTGLDPAARNDLWTYLRQIREQEDVTVVLTTHLLEEAERADRIAILDKGNLVALDTPDALRDTVGGDAITIQTADSRQLADDIGAEFQFPVEVIDGAVRLEQPEGHRLIARIVEAFPGRVDAVTFSRPSLEDVFIDRTGHRFCQDGVPEKG